MTLHAFRLRIRRYQDGVGLVELMVSVVIGLLLVVVFYQVYALSEGQKRTITSGSDSQQSASYALFLIGRDLAVAGNGIASSAMALQQCAALRPIPVIIKVGDSDLKPDTITVLYGGSASLSTRVIFVNPATGSAAYQVPGPVGFSQGDVIVAVHGDKCTVSAINKTANAVVVAANGIATLTHTPITGPTDYSYPAIDAVLVNLGQTDMIGQIKYSVVEATHTLTTQSLFPTFGPVNPASADVINLKAQYGLDTDDDGIVDTWQDPTGAVWSAETLPAILPSTLALKTWQQIRAVRVAIVTRSPQYEKDVVTDGPLSILNGTVSMPLTADQQHYRYKILETIVPLRNALWNAS